MSHKKALVFPYIPNSVPGVKAEMLKEVDAADEMELYARFRTIFGSGESSGFPSRSSTSTRSRGTSKVFWRKTSTARRT